MIHTYKQNEKKYQLLLQYTKDCKLPEKLRNEVLGTLEKYKICVYGIESKRIKELIQECKTSDSAKPMQKELHSVIFGTSPHVEHMNKTTEKHSGLEI